VTLDGLRVGLTPAGALLTERLTACAAPAVVAMVTVADALLPALTATEEGVTEITKSLAVAPAVVLRPTVVVCVVAVPFAPLTASAEPPLRVPPGRSSVPAVPAQAAVRGYQFRANQ